MQISVIFIISDIKGFISLILKVVDPLGEKFEFFMLPGILIEKDFNYVDTRIKFHSFRALKRYLKEKNLTHDPKTATI